MKDNANDIPPKESDPQENALLEIKRRCAARQFEHKLRNEIHEYAEYALKLFIFGKMNFPSEHIRILFVPGAMHILEIRHDLPTRKVFIQLYKSGGIYCIKYDSRMIWQQNKGLMFQPADFDQVLSVAELFEKLLQQTEFYGYN